jgi:hypothetical protein
MANVYPPYTRSWPKTQLLQGRTINWRVLSRKGVKWDSKKMYAFYELYQQLKALN